MKFSKIGICVSQTVNLGNYNSTKVEASIEAVVEDGDDVKAVYEAAKNEIEIQMLDMLKDVKKGK